MPNAKVVGKIAPVASHPAPVSSRPANSNSLPGSITVQDILNIINSQSATQAAALKASTWQPPAGSHPAQKSFATAPKWVAGAEYWKTGTKPMDAQ
jgi:hypothetical protein